jgi:hypothetical protein
LRTVAQRARLAPSVHNTQPWHFGTTRDTFTLRVDRSRQLHALDPTGRQMMVSVGCALFNARVAAAAAGLTTTVTRFPEPADPDLVARVHLTDATLSPDDQAIATLDPAIPLRTTNRRRFGDDPVPATLLDTLHAAAENEGARLVQVRGESDRMTVARLSQRADSLQYQDAAYRAELRAWTTDDPARLDGVPARAVPHVDAGSGDEIPIRDFDSTGAGWLPTDTRSTRNQCLLLLGTDGDDTLSWVHAGEALERILLEITRRGFAASPLTQVVEVPSARAALRSELRLTMYPHILLRVGRAPATAGTSRRHLADLLTETLGTEPVAAPH